MTIHFWDYTAAKTASVTVVQTKLRKGWKLYRVSQGFGAIAGVANYEHALVGPRGELFKVSTHVVAAAGGAVEPEVLPVSMQVLLLEGVVKADLAQEAARRGFARPADIGVQWSTEWRRWMIRPERAVDFAKWLPADAKPTAMFPSLPQEAACQ